MTLQGYHYGCDATSFPSPDVLNGRGDRLRHTSDPSEPSYPFMIWLTSDSLPATKAECMVQDAGEASFVPGLYAGDEDELVVEGVVM